MSEQMPHVPHYTRWNLSPEGVGRISEDEQTEIKKSRSTRIITQSLGAIARNAHSNILDGADAGLEAGNTLGLSLVRTSHGTEWDELFLQHTQMFLKQTGRQVQTAINHASVAPQRQSFNSLYLLYVLKASTLGMVQLDDESRSLITHATHRMPHHTAEQGHTALGFDTSFGLINYINNSLIKARARRN